jgi:hypothetical protein
MFSGSQLTAVGGADGYVASYMALGGLRWLQTLGGPLDDRVIGLVASPDGARVYISGETSVTGTDQGFVTARDSTTGAIIDEVVWGGVAGAGSNALAVDAEGNLYVAGFFEGPLDFNGMTFPGFGADDILLFSLTPDLAVRWAFAYGGPGTDRLIRLAAGPRGELAAAGVFEQTATIGNATLTSLGGQDAVVLSVATATGAPLWTASFGSANQDQAQSAAIDAAGRVYVTGAFSDTVDVLGTSLTSAGGLDSYLIRIDPE